MYNTGVAGFLAAACNPNRVIDTKAVFNLAEGEKPFGTSDIMSYKVTYASASGKAFSPGSFIASRLELDLIAASPFVAEVDFKTASVNSLFLYAGIEVHHAMANMPMGEFFPEKDGISVSDEGKVSIQATDIPPILKEQFSSEAVLTLPCTIQEALQSIALVTGLTIEVDPEQFPNLSITLTETFHLVCSYRDAISYFAEALGAYARMGRSGGVLLKRIFAGVVDVGATLDENFLFSVFKHESSVKPFQYIGIKAESDDVGVTQEVTGVSTQCRYDIINNPLTYGHPEDFLPGLVEPLAFTEFYPATISFQGRPDLDTGDVLEYIHKGVTYVLPICSHIFEYNGGFKTTVESIGSDSLQTSSLDSGAKSQITALKQNLNTLVRDLTHTQSQIIEINGELTEMSLILQTVSTLQTQISKVEGDLEKLSTLTQTAEQLRIDIQTVAKDLTDTNDLVNNNQKTILSYFDFQADALTIGVSNSNIKLKLSNNRIYFLKDGTEVAYFSEGQLYVTDAHFLRSLVLGNFEFVPRANGNLSLRRR